MENNLVDIQVLGTSFRIQVDEDPEYVKEILEYLETVISKVESTTRMKDPLKIALLTSVYLIDEIFKNKNTDNNPEMKIKASELTERIISCIESVLEDN